MAIKTPMVIEIDVVVPVKNRDTVRVVVETIVREVAAASNIELGQILLCDGGSTKTDCLRQIEAVSRLRGVTVLSYEHRAFNKGWLLNRGLAKTTAQVVLISDIDIVWRADVLEAIALCAASHPQKICSVSGVKESEDGTTAIRRRRYTYRIKRQDTETQGTETLVEICADTEQSEACRPGCGIVCAQRQAFEAVGGYKENFLGWGWEDQDFLIRAQLLGYEIETVGEVIHLSHGDEQRNRLGKSVEKSRDRNILRCLESLQKGRLVGDWEQDKAASSSRSISIKYPPTLGAKL